MGKQLLTTSSTLILPLISIAWSLNWVLMKIKYRKEIKNLANGSTPTKR